MADCLSPRSAICANGAGRLRKESGVTLLMVAVGMFALLSMAIISLDVVNVYVASNQAQKAADAAALAGAEALASSGITSNPSFISLSSVCNDADLRAQAVAAQNTIAGQPWTSVTPSCPPVPPSNPLPSDPQTNPEIRVDVTRTNMPTFFARMWGNTTTTVSATAVAEAYNPSDPNIPLPNQPPIAIHGVKPWLVFNCNTCSGGPLFITSGYGIVTSGSFIGQQFKLNLTDTTNPIPPAPAPDPAPKTAQFYAVDPPAPLACPSTTAISCDHIGTDPPNIYYHDNIACEGGFVFGNSNGNGQPIRVGPGQPIQLDTDTLVGGTLGTRTQFGTECLIHSSGPYPGGTGQDSFTVGAPLTITGGSKNPNALLRGFSIQRSDSVVTVPVFNCPNSGPCDQTVFLSIVGFLQLGIQDVDGSGNLDAVILNAAGVDPAKGGTPITGAGTSPVPVRLVYCDATPGRACQPF